MIPTVLLLHVMLWANPDSYLHEVVAELSRQWPQNRTVNIVCHGHSVPAGYFRTPVVDTFNAYIRICFMAGSRSDSLTPW